MTATTDEKHMLSIPSEKGDTRIMWDPRNKAEVAAAKAAFDTAKSQGMIAHTVDPETGGATGEVIREFDKKQGKIIMRTQLQGG